MAKLDAFIDILKKSNADLIAITKTGFVALVKLTVGRARRAIWAIGLGKVIAFGIHEAQGIIGVIGKVTTVVIGSTSFMALFKALGWLVTYERRTDTAGTRI